MQARTLAIDVLSQAAHGNDPSGERRKERRYPTMTQLCDRMMEQHVLSHCKPSTQRDYQSMMNRFIKPALGNFKVHHVERADIAALHHKMRKTPTQANRVLQILSKAFNLAEVWGLRHDGSNPARRIQKYKENKCQRFLHPEEITRLFTVLSEQEAERLETPQICAAYKLLLFTGCRLNEIRLMQWTSIREDILYLHDSKTGPRRVILSKAALEVLSTLNALRGNRPMELLRENTEMSRQDRYRHGPVRDAAFLLRNPYVIAGHEEGQPATDLQRPWRRIREQAGLEDVRIHDLRHTYASIAAMAGQSLPMIGRLLGHTQAQTTLRYAHLADDSARRAAGDIDLVMRGYTQL